MKGTKNGHQVPPPLPLDIGDREDEDSLMNGDDPLISFTTPQLSLSIQLQKENSKIQKKIQKFVFSLFF